MTTKKTLSSLILSLLGLSALVPVFVFAQGAGLDAAVNATAQTPAGGVKASGSVTISAERMAKAKTKADAEIDRRIAALNSLLARVNAMTKVTRELKQNLGTNTQTQITALTALKAKIDADTDGDTLKTDIQSIASSYRIYMLVIPQGRISAAADREATIINALTGIGLKLQARLQAAQAAGADVTALGAILTEYGKQIADAQTHAQAALSGSVVLTPDNGDKTKMAANEAALKQARTEIEAARKNIIEARKDAELIIKGLKTLKVGATSSTSVQTTP